MDINLIYGILTAIALSIILMLFQKKKRSSSWQGTVPKIKEDIFNPSLYSEYNTNMRDYVDIYYRTDTGKKGKLHLYKDQFDNLYSGLKVGDHLIKEAGKEYPEILSKIR